MHPNSRPPVPSQLVIGVVAVCLGLLFLLRNLGFIDAEWIRQCWPLVFVLFGALKIVRNGRESKSPHGFLLGGALILLGTLMTLHRLGVIDFSWHAWWPLLLIGFGVSIMMRGNFRRNNMFEWKTAAEGESEDTLDAAAVFGGYRRQVRTQNFRGGDITAVMGGCEIDMRDASINGEAVLNVVAFWGGIDIRVPADWTVVLQGSGILGGFIEKTKTPQDSSKRLIVRGYAIMGGFEVKN